MERFQYIRFGDLDKQNQASKIAIGFDHSPILQKRKDS